MNFYEILGCNQHASTEIIKQNYQKLIKKFHPDKQLVDDKLSEDFINVDKAWKTLRDDRLRKEYDALLLEKDLNLQPLIYAEVHIAELKFDANLIAFYPCRCGENICIDKGDIQDEEVILECAECSNCILVKNK